MTRFNINANPAATALLKAGGKPGSNPVRLVFEPNRVVRPTTNQTQGVSFYPRGPNRNGSKLTEALAKSTGVKPGTRYLVVKNSGKRVFELVQHSKVSGKARSFAVPLITVSATNS